MLSIIVFVVQFEKLVVLLIDVELVTMVELSLGMALGSPIELRNVKAAAIRQLPSTSASADVNGMAELSGFM